MNEPRGIRLLKEKLRPLNREHLGIKDGMEVDASLTVCCEANPNCELSAYCDELNNKLSDYLPPYLTAAPEAQRKQDPGQWMRATLHLK